MKAIPFTFLLVLVAHWSLAQNVIERQFSDYLEQEDVAHVHMTGKMFEMAAYLDTQEASEDMKEFQAFLTSIHNFDMIAKSGLESPQSVYRDALQKITPDFDELMSLREGDSQVQFFVDEKNGVVNELVFMVKDKEKFLLGTLTGEMALRHIAKLSQHLATEGNNTLTKLHEVGLDELSLYPNPISEGATLTVKVPESLIGGTGTLYGLQGEIVRRIDLDSVQTQVSTDGLSAGVYVLELSHEAVRVKRRISVQ